MSIISNSNFNHHDYHLEAIYLEDEIVVFLQSYVSH